MTRSSFCNVTFQPNLNMIAYSLHHVPQDVDANRIVGTFRGSFTSAESATFDMTGRLNRRRWASGNRGQRSCHGEGSPLSSAELVLEYRRYMAGTQQVAHHRRCRVSHPPVNSDERGSLVTRVVSRVPTVQILKLKPESSFITTKAEESTDPPIMMEPSSSRATE